MNIFWEEYQEYSSSLWKENSPWRLPAIGDLNRLGEAAWTISRGRKLMYIEHPICTVLCQ